MNCKSHTPLSGTKVWQPNITNVVRKAQDLHRAMEQKRVVNREVTEKTNALFEAVEMLNKSGEKVGEPE